MNQITLMLKPKLLHFRNRNEKCFFVYYEENDKHDNNESDKYEVEESVTILKYLDQR